MVDLILLLIFIYLIFNGLYRGFFNIFLKILGFGLGVFLGYLFYKPLSIFFSKVFLGNILIIDFMAFSFIVLLTLGLSIIVDSLLKKRLYTIKYVKLTDRILGGLLAIGIFSFSLFIISEVKNKNKVLNTLLSSSKLVSTFERVKQSNSNWFYLLIDLDLS